MSADIAAPALSLAPAAALLTPDKLTRSRWRMGVSGRGELTDAFGFGADGRIKQFKSFNETTWRLRDGMLEIFDERGALSWHFDLVFQLGDGGSGQMVLFSGYRKPTGDTGILLYLLEHEEAAFNADVADAGAAGPEPVPPVSKIAAVETADLAEVEGWPPPAPAENADVPAMALTVCVRGASEMKTTAGFLRAHVNMVEELTYAYQDWEIRALARIVPLRNEMRRPENREIVARLPGMPPNRFESDLISGASDAYVLSFSEESFQGIYQSKSTGMIIPMGHPGLGRHGPAKLDYTKIQYGEIVERGIAHISAEQWAFFREEFIFRGGFNEALFMMDVIDIFTLLRERGKQVVVIGLNATVGRDRPMLAFAGKINAIVRPLAREFGFASIDVNDFVKTESDLAADGNFGGTQFAREVYLKISDAILATLMAPRQRVADAA